MRKFRNLVTIMLFFGGLVISSHANFSSIYIWGDTLSTTTNGSTPDPQYYGMRYSNGRAWVEVLAQRQGLGANSLTNVNWSFSSNNLSYYYHLSSNVVTDLQTFKSPANASNCLFVVWVDNADFVADMLVPFQPPSGTNQALWTAAINQHLANHYNIITNLYAKGCRTLIAPNAADVTAIPYFNGAVAPYRAFVRQQVISFNASYAAMLNQIASSSPGLTIYNPDIFSLVDNVLTNAAAYGLTNAHDFYGNNIDAITALNPSILNGPGTNYIFWDDISPTAQFSEVIADFVQQYLSPVQISGLTQINGSNQLKVVNVPVGLTGFVENSTNLAQAGWTTVTNFNSLTTTQSLYVVTPPLPANFGAGGSGGSGGSGPPIPGSGGTGTTTTTSTNSYVNFAAQFYRLRFPNAWNWP